MDLNSWDYHFGDLEAKVSSFIEEVMRPENHSNQDDDIIEAYQVFGELEKQLVENISSLETQGQRAGLIETKNKYVVIWAAQFAKKLEQYLGDYFFLSQRLLWINLIKSRVFGHQQITDYRLSTRDIEDIVSCLNELGQSLSHHEQRLNELKTKHRTLTSRSKNSEVRVTNLTSVAPEIKIAGHPKSAKNRPLMEQLEKTFFRLADPRAQHESNKLLVEKYQQFIEKGRALSKYVFTYHNSHKVPHKPGFTAETSIDNEYLVKVLTDFDELEILEKDLQQAVAYDMKLRLPKAHLKIKSTKV